MMAVIDLLHHAVQFAPHPLVLAHAKDLGDLVAVRQKTSNSAERWKILRIGKWRRKMKL
jgi:hypothetical protein